MSVGEAAQGFDVLRPTLSDLVNGNVGLSAEMTLGIEKAFGFKMETLLNTQPWHDAYAMRQRESSPLSTSPPLSSGSIEDTP